MMKSFWPHRPNVKGFAIKNLASQYTKKISSLCSNEISNQLSDDRGLKYKNKDTKNLGTSQLKMKKVHWANRDFSEYQDAV